MHCTYHFFKPLVKELKPLILGKTLLDCFSQNKNELILSFANHSEETHIICNLGNNFNAFSVREKFNKAKTKFQNYFKPLIGKEIIAITLLPNDRIFYLLLKDESKIVFKLYGNRSNIIHISSNEEVEQLFLNNLRGDLEFKLESKQNEGLVLEDGLLPNQMLPTLGKEINDYFKEQGWNNWTLSEKEKELKNYLTKIETDSKFLLIENKRPSMLINPLSGYTSAIEASNELFFKLTRFHSFTEPKKKALSALQKQTKQTKSYLRKVYSQLERFTTEVSYKEKADVLMANLHLVKENCITYSLDNFYGGEPIKVELKKNEKPQELASKWYRKNKNRHLEKNKLEENILEKENFLQGLEDRLIEIESCTSAKELNKILSKGAKADKKEISLFKETHFGGFDIFIGRNSRNNDELLKFAKKDDIWLHAKDVPGSHVLIKLGNSKNVPHHVLEHVASLAAYYSKRKADSICPVIYTPKKYVHKRKGLLPGQVTIERENVLLVEPKKLEGS